MFKTLAKTASIRSARGVACIIVKDSTVEGKYIYTREKQITQTYDEDNSSLIKEAFNKYGVNKLVVYAINKTSGTLEDALDNLKKVEINYLACNFDLQENDINGGNMKRIKFYVCPNCGNVINSTGDGDFSCCGRKLEALVPKVMDENHSINIEEVENDYYIEINHEMTKEHFISFVAYVTYDRVLLIKLYPEQSPTVRFPRLCGKFERGKFYMYCNQHGLLMKGK